MRKKIDLSVWDVKCCKQNKISFNFSDTGVDDHQIKFGNQFLAN